QPASPSTAATANDKATLSLHDALPISGKVSWKLYDNETCSSANGGVVAEDGPVSVTGNASYVTPNGASPTLAGTYYWVATYSGDQNNKAISSGCDDEPVVIGPASPATTTTQEPASPLVRSPRKEQAHPTALVAAHPP